MEAMDIRHGQYIGVQIKGCTKHEVRSGGRGASGVDADDVDEARVVATLARTLDATNASPLWSHRLPSPAAHWPPGRGLADSNSFAFSQLLTRLGSDTSGASSPRAPNRPSTPPASPLLSLSPRLLPPLILLPA
jgi:hypothetical protein